MAGQARLSTVLLIGSLIAGLSYVFAVRAQLMGPEIIAWKGLGVGLLACFAAVGAQGRDSWLLVGILALGAAGDIVLELDFTGGAALFALGHILAIILYRRHIRHGRTQGDRLIGALLIGLPVGIAWALTQRAEVALYTLLLGSMASAAWSSQFPARYTALGATMFVVSDLLIFAHMGPLQGIPAVSLLIWMLYFGGQYLIALGGRHYLANQQAA